MTQLFKTRQDFAQEIGLSYRTFQRKTADAIKEGLLPISTYKLLSPYEQGLIQDFFSNGGGYVLLKKSLLSKQKDIGANWQTLA